MGSGPVCPVCLTCNPQATGPATWRGRLLGDMTFKVTAYHSWARELPDPSHSSGLAKGPAAQPGSQQCLGPRNGMRPSHQAKTREGNGDRGSCACPDTSLAPGVWECHPARAMPPPLCHDGSVRWPRGHPGHWASGSKLPSYHGSSLLQPGLEPSLKEGPGSGFSHTPRSAQVHNRVRS